MIEWLQKWYEEQCDGDWEHGYGVRIETIDNPGWSVRVDLNGIKLNMLDFEYKLFEKSENDWVGFSLERGTFHGIGDSSKLNTIISVFRELTLEEKSNINTIMSNY